MPCIYYGQDNLNPHKNITARLEIAWQCTNKALFDLMSSIHSLEQQRSYDVLWIQSAGHGRPTSVSDTL